MAKHKIALIPGDGIGKEVLPEGVRVLEAAGRRFGFELEFTDFDWSCDRFAKTGKMMPDDCMETLKGFESIFLGAVGWPGVPDHVSLWGLLIPIRREFDESDDPQVIGGAVAGGGGGHVGHDDIGLVPTHGGDEGVRRVLVVEILLQQDHARNRSHLQIVDPDQQGALIG